MCTEANEIKKEYLMRYLESKKVEKALLREMEELEGRYILPSKVIDDMPHGGAGDADLSEFAAKYDKLYQRIKVAYERSMEIYHEIFDAIEAMDTGEAEKAVLHYRYIMGYTWEKIAVEMDYVYRHVLRLHGIALSKFTVPKRKMS